MKVASSTHNSDTPTSFFSEQTIVPQKAPEMPYAYFLVCHTQYSKDLDFGQDFIKLIIFTAPSQTCLNEIGFFLSFFLPDFVAVKNMIILSKCQHCEADK